MTNEPIIPSLLQHCSTFGLKNVTVEIENMCNYSDAIEQIGYQNGEKIGYQNGEKIGEKIGMENMALVMSYLVSAGRTDDIIRSANDPEFRSQIYKEYLANISSRTH